MSTAARFALGLLVAAAVLVIGLQIHRNSDRPAVGPTGPSGVTGVLRVPPATPHRKMKKKRGGHALGQADASDSSPSNEGAKSEARPYTPRSRARRRNPPRTRPDPSKPGNAPYTPPSGGGQPQPPPQEPPPPVDLRVPAPVTGCLRPVGGLNC